MNRKYYPRGDARPVGGPQRRPTEDYQGHPAGGPQDHPAGGFQGHPGGRRQGQPARGPQGHPAGGFQGHPEGRRQGNPARGLQDHPAVGFQGHPEGRRQGHPARGPQDHPSGGLQDHPSGGLQDHPAGGLQDHPAGGFQGHPAPPPNYSHRPNYQMTWEERINLCHNIHNKKERISQLEDLLDVRMTEFTAENKKNYQTISRLEIEISYLKESLQLQEEKMEAAQRLSKKKYEEMVSKYEAERQTVSSQDNQMLMSKDESLLPAENGMKVTQMEEQIRLKDTEIQELTLLFHRKEQSLSQRLSETNSQLLSKAAELLQSEEAWQEKYNTLEQKYAKDLADKEQSLEILQAEYRKKVTQMEEQIHQKDAEILNLSKVKDSLTQKLTATMNQLLSNDVELLQSEKAWQAKYIELEDKFRKDLTEKEQGWESKEKQMETKLKLLEEEKKELEEKFTKHLSEKEQSSETEVKQMKDDKEELQELCLKMRKKKRGFLSFKKTTEDRGGKGEEERMEKKKGFFSWLHKK